MVYVEKGHVLHQQSVWSVKAFVDTFWAVVNGIVFFWETLVSPSAAAKYKHRSSTKKRSDRKQDGKRGGSNGPRITGLSNLRDNSNPPAGAGGC
ncbi:hypothetical protein WJX79_007796 [Trebouxia sp. C0005]